MIRVKEAEAFVAPTPHGASTALLWPTPDAPSARTRQDAREETHARQAGQLQMPSAGVDSPRLAAARSNQVE